MLTETVASAQTVNVTAHCIDWHGKQVILQSEWALGLQMCAPDQHHVEVMHHIGNPDGKHYCPTGFVWCPVCGAIGDEPEPNECTRWGESDKP